jgi:hypothetical protein
VLEPLLSLLSPGAGPPRLTVESLRALAVILETLHESPLQEYVLLRHDVGEVIFSAPHVDNLAHILAQQEHSHSADDQLILITQIVRCGAEACPRFQWALLSAGILDLLSSRLASLIVKTQPQFQLYDPAALSSFLPPPPKNSFSSLLEAISVIVEGSAYRSARFFYSRDIFALFPTVPTFPTVSDPYSPLSDPFSSIGIANHHWERVLPQLTSTQTNKSDAKSDALLAGFMSKNFPVLSSQNGPSDATRVPFAVSFQEGPTSDLRQSDELQSDLLAWLLHMVRSSSIEERLATASLLAKLLNATDLNVHCERPLALLVIPLLARMLDEASQPVSAKSMVRNQVDQVRVRAPLILAKLVENSAVLQKAAVDADIIKILCPLLKRSFDPVATSKRAMWSPNPDMLETGPRSVTDPKAIGPESIALDLLTAFCLRSNTMQALAAIAQKEDETRKLVIENGVVPCIVDALQAYTDGADPVNLSGSVDPSEGNPAFVLAPALHFLTTLSRSVSILRTSLIDGGVAKPAFQLLRHPDLGVQKAAVDSMVNLVLHFSPMKPVSLLIPNSLLF